ncbi:MAG: adenylate/guanylate cyclase domain-containing protein [Saprospiraceae bacterium]
MKIVLLLPLIFLLTTGWAQPSQQTVDSLQLVFEQCKTDTGKASLLRPIYYNMRQISPDSALQYLQKVSDYADKQNFTTLKARALYLTGYHYCAIRAENKIGMQYYIEALSIAEKAGDKLNTASCLMGLGSIYILQQQNDRAIESYKKAVKLYEELNNNQLLAIALSGVASTMLETGDNDEVLKVIEKGLAVANKLNDQTAKAHLLLIKSRALEGKGDLRKAVEFGQIACDTFCQLGNNQYCAYSLTIIAKQYLELHNTRAALNLALRARDVCDQYGLAVEKEHAYDVLDDIYFDMGDYKTAYFYKNQLMDLRDSSSNIKQAAELASMEMKYEQDKKDAIATTELKRQKDLRNRLLIAFVVALLFSGMFLFQRIKIRQEQRRSENLLLNILPPATAKELKSTGAAQAKHVKAATVMFTDFKDFTSLSEQMSADELVKDIHYYFSEFDKIIERFQVEKIKTIGDSYMCAAGLPLSRKDHAIDAVKAALAIRDFMQKDQQKRQKRGLTPLEIRIGLHSGPVVSGVVGIKKFAYDIWGDTVNIAARMESTGEAGKVNISSATYELVQADFFCEYRGKMEVKNKGMVDMYFVDWKKMA